jgi:hypothetical protein
MESNNKSLSKMNKKELYVECKRLKKENMTHQLFQDDNLNFINLLKEEIEKLKRDVKFSHTLHTTKNEILDKFQEEIKSLKEEIVNIVNIKNKQIKKEKYKYECMCSEQADSDCAKYIQELVEEIKKLKEDNDKFRACAKYLD